MAKRKYMYKGSNRQPIKKCSKGRVLGIFEKSKFNENSNFESDSKFQQCYDTKNAILANLAFLSVDMDNLLVGEFSLQVRNFSHNFFVIVIFNFRSHRLLLSSIYYPAVCLYFYTTRNLIQKKQKNFIEIHLWSNWRIWMKAMFAPGDLNFSTS